MAAHAPAAPLRTLSIMALGCQSGSRCDNRLDTSSSATPASPSVRILAFLNAAAGGPGGGSERRQ